MNIEQILPKTKVASAAPIMELLENDQVLPAGMWRWRIQGDVALLERATATDWSTVTTALSISNAGVVTPLGTALADDQVLSFGGVVSFLWETQDANANELLIDLPAGGAVDVPVIVIGQGVTGVDLGLYNGVTEPRLAIFGIGAVTTAPIWEFRKARGTIAAPTVITTGDDLGSINAYACVAAGEWVQSAAIEFDSAGTIATTRGPGIIRFKTATDAAPSVLTTRLTINEAGLATFAAGITLTGTITINGGFSINGIGGMEVLPGARVTIRDGATLDAYDVDSNFFGVRARDNGVGLVDVVRVIGAADPFLQIGRDDTGVALNAVTDMLVLQAGGGTGNIAANFGFGISFVLASDLSANAERASLDLVVTNPTLATYACKFNWSVMSAGALVNSVTVDGKGLTCPASVDSAAVADMVTLGAFDLSAGNRALAVSSEHAVAVAAGIASTHKVGVRWNGATYYIMLSNV